MQKTVSWIIRISILSVKKYIIPDDPSHISMLKKTFKYLIPYWMKKSLKTGYYSFLDFVDLLRGKRNPKLPPRRLNFVGSADFEKVGNEFKELFIKLGHFRPDDAVLDIGCGVGRMALPLADYLDATGEYYGFDIVKKGIDWCQKNIEARYRRFKFYHADIKNKFYNSTGKIKSEHYKFPVGDDSCTFCFATSVYTHMLPVEVEHYLRESARIMKKGGKIFFTFFLIPESAKDTYKTAFINFQYRLDNLAYYSHKDCVEAEAGYPETWVRKVLAENGFRNVKIYPGKWRNPAGVSYQDILIAEK